MKMTLKLLNIINIDCNETDILKIAKDFKITFYDSAYVFIAKTKKISLVTEDEKLKRKIGNYEMSLVIATRAYTRRKSDFLWVPSNEKGDGTYISHLKFREVSS